MVLDLAQLTGQAVGRRGMQAKCHDCSAPPLPGRTCCAVHAEKQRQSNARYHARLAAARPPREPRPKPEGGYRKRWREQKIAAGLCPQCGKDPLAGGYKRCDSCRAKNTANATRQRRAKGAKPRGSAFASGLSSVEYVKLLKLDQRAKGLCEYGRCQSPPEAGHTQCRPHLNKTGARIKELLDTRTAAGLCRQCGEPWTETQTCPTCRPRTRSHAERRKAREAREAEALRAKTAERQQTIDTLERHIHVIRDERTKTILHRRIKGDTLEEIGGDLNITRERVRQIEKKANALIQRSMNRGGPINDLTTIETIDISPRLEHILTRMGVTTLYELRHTPARELLVQKHFGKACMREIDELLDLAQDGMPPPLEGLA